MGVRDKVIDFITAPTKSNNTMTTEIRPQVPSTKDAAPATKKSSSKSNIIKALLKPLNLALDYSDDFVAPEVDLSIIDIAYNTEAYVRQGLDKYIDLMFKAGWEFTGNNQAATDYIKMRFAWMAEVTGIPTNKFFIEYGEDVVKYANAIIVKARMKDQTQIPQGVTITGLDGKQPVAGYFLLNPTTMSVKRDKNGTPKQWQQKVAGQDKEATFKASEVIHTYHKRMKGAAFGTPFLLPVLDDIRALRQVEDNIIRNLYRNVFPFYHVIVGTETAPADDEEVDKITASIQNMSTEGGLVTSERVNVKPIASDQVIEAEPYLRYHEDRVFTGIGVPATMFGRGSTANKSTSDNLAKEFVDRCKAFDRAIETDVDEFMIKELLYEGGFDPIMNPDDMVHFKFKEIDVDSLVKQRNQSIFEYEHNAISEDEMRVQLGLDPIADGDREKMHLAIITLAVAEETARLDAENSADTNNKVTPKNQHAKSNVAATYKLLLDRLHNDVALQLSELFDSSADSIDETTLHLAMCKINLLIDNAHKASLYIYKDYASGNTLDAANKLIFNDIRTVVLEAVNSLDNDALIAVSGMFEMASDRAEILLSSNLIQRSV